MNILSSRTPRGRHHKPSPRTLRALGPSPMSTTAGVPAPAVASPALPPAPRIVRGGPRGVEVVKQ